MKNCPISVPNLMIIIMFYLVRNDIRTTGLIAVLNIIRITMLLIAKEPDEDEQTQFLS